MANFLREGEQMLDSQGGNNNDQQQQGGSGGFDQNQQQGGQQQTQQGGQGQQQSSGGGEDAMINKEVDSFASKEGIPSAADGEINKFVDKEAGNF